MSSKTQNAESSVSEEDRIRFRQLFAKLDVNKDGRIEVNELAVALRAQAVPEKDAKGHAHVSIFAYICFSLRI